MKGPMSKKTKEPPKKGESQGDHLVPKPPLVARSISNKERKSKFTINGRLLGVSIHELSTRFSPSRKRIGQTLDLGDLGGVGMTLFESSRMSFKIV
jgi:hypothetical protein